MLLNSILTLALLMNGPTIAAGGQPERAVALKIEAFKDGFRLCSREAPQGISGYWELGKAEVERIDRALMVHLSRSGLQGHLSAPPSRYERQYLGLVRGARRAVYINAFPVRGEAEHAKARMEFAEWCDGGSLFWGIEYDVKSRRFLNFSANIPRHGDPLEGLRR
jgi:hypothetical protein